MDFEKWRSSLKVIQTVDTARKVMKDLWAGNRLYTGPSHSGCVPVCLHYSGPPVMIKFTILEILKRGVPEENIWISHERKMCCGLGKCGHCKINDTYICLDGPVFHYSESKDLID